ncbi:MAG: alcohol dehydrogenase catalytic domain-containing protein [Aestuariivita sp.]|nr:alcohol dehydrogenase catalytic domain-containing protein [Aestuariivita sp.]MCY4201666.1 alcohol dehydrogenase catalytic domain-containing protein [Aestuariivita sp.]MCY4287933.1 alcohol dehydrogenase catalytic domain-containing protein [Aestuariivita sp.]MCY4348188.1 alcohol dehydrogenase catalytic domain-containing protein [Aestuariivita sp.]
MKALLYTAPESLRYTEVADVVAPTDHQIVRIDSVGICGSDMHAFLGHDDRRPAPLILGHEGAGTVIGGELDGKHVTINPLVTCSQCRACLAGRDNLCETRQILSMPPREGAFAQLVAVPKQNLVIVPQSFPLSQAALAEPIAVGWHAVRLGLEAAASDIPNSAVVFGGGAIGVASALCLSHHGIADITLIEPNELRRDYLKESANYGVEAPSKISGHRFDFAIDSVGIDATREAASAVVNPGGVILHIGLGGGSAGLDIRRMTLQEVTMIGTYTYTAHDFRNTCEAMFERRLGPLDWTEARPLAAGARAFDDIRNGRVAAPKILLQPE